MNTADAASGRLPLEGGESDEERYLRTVPRLRARTASPLRATPAARRSRFRVVRLVNCPAQFTVLRAFTRMPNR
jgi:hypothetical protein